MSSDKLRQNWLSICVLASAEGREFKPYLPLGRLVPPLLRLLPGLVPHGSPDTHHVLQQHGEVHLERLTALPERNQVQLGAGATEEGAEGQPYIS